MLSVKTVLMPIAGFVLQRDKSWLFIDTNTVLGLQILAKIWSIKFLLRLSFPAMYTIVVLYSWGKCSKNNNIYKK